MDQDPTPSGRKEPQRSESWLAYSGFAFQLLGGIGVAGWIGYKLDNYLSLHFPVFMLLFILLVFSGMIYQINRRLNQ
jgi:F0F1-type ATP synthase assembly protein I